MNIGSKDTNGNNKKKGLIIGIAVGILMVIAVVGVLIFLISQKDEPEAYKVYHKEFSGFGLYSSLSEPGDAVTICFDGEKSNLGNFKGTLTVIKGGQQIVEYKNCRIEKHEDGYYYVKQHLDWTPDMDSPKPNDVVFRISADENWNEILILPVFNEISDYAMIVAPATTHEEAKALVDELF